MTDLVTASNLSLVMACDCIFHITLSDDAPSNFSVDDTSIFNTIAALPAVSLAGKLV